MKFTLLPLIALATSIPAALAAPAPDAVAAAEVPEATVFSAPLVGRDVELLEKRANAGVVRVDGLRYRTCPRTSCTAIGQYPIGTRITIVCYTRDNTTPINGDRGWARLTNGYWVALAWGEYVSWTGSIPYC